jgi:restriction system protein
MARGQKGPQFIRFLGPVIEALQDLGGSGRPAEVVDWIATKLDISEEEQNALLASGQSRFTNEIHWARFYLAKTGYIDSSKRGVWSLSTKGLSAQLTRQDALAIFREVQAAAPKKLDEVDTVSRQDEESLTLRQEDYRSHLVEILQGLPADGFERLCQRLLRESGFQQVHVTGKTGDGGIDGNGLLQVNPFVSFQVLFQCKRYSGSVSASQVRDFRGAMMGRADKGIIMTTGTFTKDAKREAVRDGVPPIELVDGEKLLDMFEQLELGLEPITTYEVDDEFFEEFRDKKE